MASNRIEQLYKQKLVNPEVGNKTLPLDHILKKTISYFPQKPESMKFDILEIGPGNGEFLFNMAETYPQKNILGIEIGGPRFHKMKLKIEKRDIKNVTLAWGDARVALHNDLPNSSLEKCFVLFPDPWPRNRHRHRRLLQQEFLKLIAAKLKVDGIFILATDVADYASWVLDNLKKTPNMKNVLGKNQMASQLEEIPPTYFSKKWQNLGRNFNYVKFAKVGE